MKKFIKKFSVILMLATLVLAMNTMSAQAATRKVTAKKVAFTSYESKAAAKATRVKTGTYRVSMKGQSGFLKFTAPKSGYYTFTIGAMDPFSTNKIACGYAYIMGKSSVDSLITFKKFSTKGGKTETCYFETPYSYSISHSAKVKATSYLTSRNCKLKLVKGQTYYVYLSTTSRSKITVKIKKG